MQATTHIADLIELLEQAKHVVEHIDDGVFATTTPISPRGSIAGHLRHILDSFQCFLNGLQTERIDYNLRQRDARVEQERTYAIRKIEGVIAALDHVRLIDPHLHVLVSSEDQPQQWCRSSVGRELEFLKSHTIHHYSLIAMLLRLHEIDPGEEFGVAPSTLRHWREAAACVR